METARKQRIKASGNERDAFEAKEFLCWSAGERKWIKRHYNRRLRKQGRVRTREMLVEATEA